MSTTTIRPTTTTFAWCEAESEPAGRCPEGAGGEAAQEQRAALNAPFDLRALYAAYQRCRRGKRQARNTRRFEASLPDRLVETADAIARLAWQPSRTLSFVVSQPKWREIHAADFADRVVHTLLVSRLEALYEPLFIHDSYANRLGKGSHAAVNRLQAQMRCAQAVAKSLPAPQAGHPSIYFLQLDVANFFNSIHRPTLFRLLQARLQRAHRQGKLTSATAQTLQHLCRAVLAPDPGRAVLRKGPPHRFAQVPAHKRLGALGPAFGLPIGNLTSQFFANVYLNELDQFVKHTLKARWVVRYVDDIVLIHHDRAQLAAWHLAIADFLRQRLCLALRPGARVRPVADGVDFLGYIVRPHYRLSRRRVLNRLRALLDDFARRHVRAGAATALAFYLPPDEAERLRARLHSFVGHLRHAAHRSLFAALRRRFPWLDALFDWPDDALGSLEDLAEAPRAAWQPPFPAGLGSEIRWFQQRHRRLILVRVGREILLAGRQALWLAERGVLHGLAHRVERPGVGQVLSLPRSKLAAARARLKRAGLAHALVDEAGARRDGRLRRVLTLSWVPSDAPGRRGAASAASAPPGADFSREAFPDATPAAPPTPLCRSSGLAHEPRRGALQAATLSSAYPQPLSSAGRPAPLPNHP